MDRVKPATVTDAREFFSAEIRSVLEKHRISTRVECVEYLVCLLIKNMESKNFFTQSSEGKLEDNILVDLYAEYLRSDITKKKIVLQRLGDICLLMSGFFAENLQRKLNDIDYYFGMGGNAYQTLSKLQSSEGPRVLYTELSQKFEPFSNVLGEMSERSGLQSNSDILRLYERWNSTGSARLKGLLSEQGIQAPFAIDLKIKH